MARTDDTTTTNEDEYDVDERVWVDGYKINHNYNFIDGAEYSQKTLAEIGERLSYKDAIDEAVAVAKEKGAYGFFYQQHDNSY